MSPSRAFDLRELERNFSRTRNHRGRTERIGLRNQVVTVFLDDKQLFGNALLLPHDQPDLFDTGRLAQVGVNQQRAVCAGLRFTVSQQLGNNVIARLQHRADDWYLVGFIGDEMNAHSKANRD